MSNGDAALGATTRGSSKLRRRFLLTGLAGLAVLGPILGVSFLGDTGTSSPTITGSTASNLVYTNALPCDMLNGTASASIKLEFSSVATTLSSASGGNCPSSTPPAATSGTFTPPSWSPVTNSAGAVSQSGDLALVDASAATSNVILDIYITNLQALGLDYSSFAFPINIYQCSTTTTCTGSSSWSAVGTTANPNSDFSYLTSSSGFYSVSLPPGYWYDVTLDASTSNGGGEFYCISTNASGGSLAPSFFFTATVS